MTWKINQQEEITFFSFLDSMKTKIIEFFILLTLYYKKNHLVFKFTLCILLLCILCNFIHS